MRWIPAVSGLIATAAAVLVIVSLAQTPQRDTSAPPPEAPIGAVEQVVESPPTTIQQGTRSEPDVSVLGVDTAVSNALIDAGYTEFVGSNELRSQLPDSVADALTRHGSVLVIPNEDES